MQGWSAVPLQELQRALADCNYMTDSCAQTDPYDGELPQSGSNQLPNSSPLTALISAVNSEQFPVSPWCSHLSVRGCAGVRASPFIMSAGPPPRGGPPSGVLVVRFERSSVSPSEAVLWREGIENVVTGIVLPWYTFARITASPSVDGPMCPDCFRTVFVVVSARR